MSDWPRVKELFHDALEREPAERAAFLHAACGDEAGVRVEVERLLAAHDHAGGFIEQSPVTSAGRVLGHYELERLVGVGGMGEVYRARDLELGRTVAIKVAIGHDADAQARLRREAQHASQLNHPNISTIYEVGTSDGHPFIVMELVEGERLSDLVPPGGLPAALVRQYGMQIADALAHAHRQGVTHRDLKSANVVVTPEGRAKVLDFGLARRISTESLKEVSQSPQSATAEGMVAGTLSCMAPELFRGAAADARSDIWSLGVLLYEIATGERPFDGSTGFELSAAILHESPKPFPASIPGSLRTIIARCLEKDQSARYQSASEVYSALAEPKSDPRPQEARGGACAAAKPSFLARRWQQVVAGLLAIVLVYGSYRVLRRDDAPVAVGPSGRPAIAVMNFENHAGGNAAWLSQGIPSMLLTGLAQTQGLEIVSTQRLHEAARQRGARDLSTLEQGKAADIAKQAGAGAIVVGSIYTSGADIRIDARVEDLASGRVLAAQSVRGTDAFALVDQLAARIREGVGLFASDSVRGVADISTSSLEAFRLFSIGNEAFINARADDARTAFEEAVRLDPAFAEAYIELAAVAGFSGQTGRRREHLRDAARHADRLSERRRLLLNVRIARDEGNTQEVSRLLDELIEKFPETEAAYTIAGLHYTHELRDLDKLLRLTARGASALPASASVRNNYGYALLEAGRYTEAIREFEKYVQLAPGEANPYDSLAEAHFVSGSPAKAVELYSRALTIDPTFPSAHLSWTLAAMGRYDEALAAKPSLNYLEGFLLSRVGRYREAAAVLDAGRQQTERNENLAEQSEYMLISAFLRIERKDYTTALRELALAEKVTAGLTEIRQRRDRVLIHLLGGLAELGAGRRDAARARLNRSQQLYNSRISEERLWYHSLEGEIALADRDLKNAAAAFAKAEPPSRKPMRLRGWLTLFDNSFPFRDGPVRAAKAQGDLRRAIELYRQLLVYGPESRFLGMLEPRYVLELARLLEETGEQASALKEYERFLQLWKNADNNLPELAEARRAVARLSKSG